MSQQALEAVQIVKAVKARKIGIEAPAAITFFSVNDEWVYTAVYDNRVCDDCLQYEHETFFGNDVRAMFPEWEVVDLERIDVHVHPNCRCHLDRILYLGDIGKEIE